MTAPNPNVVWILQEIDSDGEHKLKVFTTEQKGQIYQQQRERELAQEFFVWYKEKKLVKNQDLQLLVHTTTKETERKFQTWWQKLETDTLMDNTFVELYWEMEMGEIHFVLEPHVVS